MGSLPHDRAHITCWLGSGCGMLHDPKTVIGSDFDQETAEKIAPPFIPRLELANYSISEVLDFQYFKHIFLNYYFCDF